jgi:signal transduction histidine kinase/ligand-binding sensor domain-containing protein/DNA-binding response OmpR family regulator
MQRLLLLSLLFLFIAKTYAQAPCNRVTWINLGTERGLVHPRVNTMVIDKNGFLWIGTYMGLNRFDGRQFIAFRHNPLNNHSLSDDYIRSLFIDRNNTLWAGTDNGVLNRYNPSDRTFTRYEMPLGSENRKSIRTITEDHSGNIWAACIEGLVRINPETTEMTVFRNTVFPGTTGTLETLYIDELGRFWAGFWEGGLFLFDPLNGTFKRFFNDPEYPELMRISPMVIKEDSRHNLWIGTYNAGLIRISHPGQSVTVYSHKKNDSNSLNSNKVKSLEILDDKRIWIGTEEGGIDLFEPDTGKFSHFMSGIQSDRSVEGESIYTIVKDESNRLWLGSRENGIYYLNAGENPFCHINRTEGIAAEEPLVITSFCEDPSQRVWAGIYGDIALVDFSRKMLIPQSLNLDETPNTLAADNKGNIWIGGLRGGIYLYAPEKKTTQAFRFSELEGLKIISFHFEENQAFIGLEGKFAVLEMDDKELKMINNPSVGGPFQIIPDDSMYYFFSRRQISVFPGKPDSDPGYQPLSTVDYLFPNSKCAVTTPGYLYCGTDAGLFTVDKKTLTVSFLEKLPGPISYSVKSILAEDAGTVWFSTAGNIVRYTPESDYIRIFDQFDGIPQMAFRDAVGCKTSDGRMIMGGMNGLLAFYPEQLKRVIKVPGIEIGTLILGRQFKNVQQIAAVDYTENSKPLKLRYNQNFFSINWSMPEFIQPEKILYAWMMEGFDKEWNAGYNQTSANYMNLPRGEYTFQVRGKDTENNWSETRTLQIHISPPFWLTWYAYTFYLILLIVLLYAYRNFNIKKERLKNELDIQRLKMDNIQQLVEKEHELNEWKFGFFTNVSHEFKTPLTLIISPLEQYLETGSKLTDITIRQIHGNAQRLYRLITQILDFRKMEAGKLELNYSYDDIVAFMVNICQRFKNMANHKNLGFEVMIHEKQIFTRFDADKIEKVLYNLLSNAIKFTSEGKIKAEISQLGGKLSGGPSDWVQIIIKDTGVGIPPDLLPHIFDRFYQVRQKDGKTQGTGIGLSLVQELVKMHGGEIEVTSAVNTGTTFIVRIPVVAGEAKEIPEEAGQKEDWTSADAPREIKQGRYSVLIAEDNEEMRSYIARELQPDYDILEAPDGEVALDMCRKHQPDLVLSDILMPGTDGLEFCRQLKNDDKVSHIPLLMITALSSAEYQEQAYRLGADDYITKPFKINILKEKIHNFISSREALKKQFLQNAFSEPSILKIASNDEKFLKRTHEVIEENLSDSEFDIDRFAREMASSRSQLYRKLKALTGLPASEYMKITRLKIAARMISEKNYNISEAAYLVGFKDPKYFSKCFQKQFGVIPSRYKPPAGTGKVES